MIGEYPGGPEPSDKPFGSRTFSLDNSRRGGGRDFADFEDGLSHRPWRVGDSIFRNWEQTEDAHQSKNGGPSPSTKGSK